MGGAGLGLQETVYNASLAQVLDRGETTMTTLLPLRPILISGLCVCSAFLHACSGGEESIAAPDLIVINADVYTMDSTAPRVEAIGVSEGKFVAVGSSGDIELLADAETEVIDANGAAILPGLIDGHTHLVGGSGLATGVDLSDIEDKNEWLRIIADKAEQLPDGAWILGGAWNHNLSDGVLPTKEMLDVVVPDNSVLLDDIDHHSSWANSLAIELAGVTADSPVPPGGEIVIDPATGEMTGIFLEGASHNDIHLVLGSDWATSPLNPLIQIADTVHRETRIDGVVQPWDEGNTLSFEEALHGYTQAGADMTSWGDEVGSITVGKWADFVVLDERLPANIDGSIENRQVTATYLAGTRVYP